MGRSSSTRFRCAAIPTRPRLRSRAGRGGPYHNEALLLRGIGIRLNGQEKTNAEEYCISEGWIRVAAGKAVDRKGKPLTLKLKGTVEVWILDDTDDAATP